MAALYTTFGEAITVGLQGSVVCDEAIQAAKALARDRGHDVVLDDDDGSYLVSPDGSVSPWEWE